MAWISRKNTAPALVTLLALGALVAALRDGAAPTASDGWAAENGPALAGVSSAWPILGLGAAVPVEDGAGAELGAPRRLRIPVEGSVWKSPGPVETSGFVVAWARLKGDFAATAIGSISADGMSWTEVIRSGANANRSLPHLNLMLPVPRGHHFRLQLQGARGGGLEIVEESGGHWFPLTTPAP